MKNSRTFSISIKFTALILAVLTAIMSLPIAAFAIEMPNASANNNPVLSEDNDAPSSDCLIELTGERDRNTKKIRSSDGKITVAEYGMPVHIRKSDGSWDEIDNRLTDKGDYYLTGNTDISIAKELSEGSFAFSLDNGKITVWMPRDKTIKYADGIVSSKEINTDERTDFEKMTILDNLTSEVTYRGILPSTDFRYTVTPNGVKEEIILQKNTGLYDFSFVIRTNGLKLATDESGNIIAVNPESGDAEYFIPAPFAYDSTDNYTNEKQCFYTLTEGEDYSYTVTVCVNPDWMNAQDRVYPVTIDPTVYFGGYGILNMRDTMVSQNYPANNYGTKKYLKAGYDSANKNVYIYIAPWSLPSIPAGAYIADAQLNLTANGTNNYTSGELTLVAKKIIHTGYSSIWGETSVCWNTGCTYGDILDYNVLSAPSSGKVVHWNITSAVRDWYNNSSSFQGIAIMQYNTSSTAQKTIQFHASESTTIGAGYTPFFTYTYISTLGVEGYYSYFSSDAGLAGVGYVNAATGALTLSKSLMSTTDSLFPYTVSLVYNSGIANKTYTSANVQTVYDSNWSPYGFKLNLQETVIQKEYLGENNNDVSYYIWSDSDGTEHWFRQKNGSTTEYEDEDGLQLVLKKVNSSLLTISDDSGTVRKFEPMSADSNSPDKWYLSSIEDSYQNRIVFAVDTLKRPTAVQLVPVSQGSPISFLNISYDSNSGLPYAIWNSMTKEAVILKYSQTYSGSLSTTNQKYLRQIVYLKGNTNTTFDDLTCYNYYYSGSTSGLTVVASAYYTYDSSGRIASVKDGLSGYEIRYTWTSGKVSAVQEYGGTSSGQKIGITYSDGYTDVRNSGSDDVFNNSDDIITRYIFDDNARTLSTYSSDVNGTQIYGASSGEYVSGNEKVKNSLKTETTVGGSSSTYLLNGGFEILESNGSSQYWNTTGNVHIYSSSSLLFQAGGHYYADLSVTNGSTSTLYQYTRLPAGTYSFSMSVHTVNCNGITARVKAVSLNSSAHSYTEEIPLNKYYASGGEGFFTFSFDAANINSTGYEAFRIVIEISGVSSAASGASFSVDNIMLEKAVGCSNYNLVQMGNFEQFHINSSNVLQNATVWSSNYGTPVYENVSAPFGRSIKVSSDISSKREVSQVIYAAPQEALDQYDGYGWSDYDEPLTGRQFSVSGFSKGTGQIRNADARFGIRVDVEYYFGYGSIDTVSYSFDYTVGCQDWQFICGNFRTEPNLLVKTIKVFCEYSNQPSGYALFDNISVTEVTDGSIVNYEYYGEEDGVKNGLLHVKTSGYYEEYYEYNSNRQLTRTANNNYEIHDYNYSESNIYEVYEEIYYTFTLTNSSAAIYPYNVEDPDSRIIKTPKTRTLYYYTENGQPSQTTTCEAEYRTPGGVIVPKSGTKYIVTESTYNETPGSSTFGALVYQTDSLGRGIRYVYDECGRLKSTINVSEGTGTYYEYNLIGNLIATYPAVYNTYSGASAVEDEEHVNYSYNSQNYLESIITDSTEYILNYDAFGNQDSIYVGDNLLFEYEYNPNNGKITKVYYGDSGNKYVRYIYDSLGNISEIRYKNGNTSEEAAFRYTYTAYGQLSRVDNLLTGKSTSYKYAPDGKITSIIDYDTSDSVNEFGISYSYNDDGKIDYIWNSLDYIGSGGVSDYNWHYYISYKPNGNIEYYDVNAGNVSGREEYLYDGFDRLEHKIFTSGSFSNTVCYQYCTSPTNSSRTSGEIYTYRSRINSAAAVTSTFTYDNKGNITKIHLSNGTEYRYVYDTLGQLTREDNTALSRTVTYEYDDAGNLRYQRTYALTAEGVTPSGTPVIKTYGYGDNSWGDLLTSFNGVNISYDGIGNPLSYYNGSSYSFTWKNGRQLTTAVKGNNTLSFAYNDEGIRTQKTVNGTVHTYHVTGAQIETEEWGNNLLIYLYDADGSPIGMQYKGTGDTFYTFWFEKNLQGDIVAVYNQSGVKCVSYVYDAWGNTARTIHNSSGSNAYAQYNPFTYRSYYYDSETGLYYLNNRYYDPEVGRFINADEIDYLGADGSLTGFNLFAYCGNNPVMGYDPCGTFDFWRFAKGVGRVVTGVSAVIAGAVVCIAGAPASMIVVAALTVTAGVLTIVNGSADIQQATTEENFVRDSIFKGNQTAYDIYSGVIETAAVIGTTVCGNYFRTNCTMKGAVPGTSGKTTLEPGTTIDRYGSQYGRYLTDPGTPVNQLALTPGNSGKLTTYVVNRPLTLRTGVVAKCDWGPGGGVQYFSWMSVQRLVQFGFLTAVG